MIKTLFSITFSKRSNKIKIQTLIYEMVIDEIKFVYKSISKAKILN